LIFQYFLCVFISFFLSRNDDVSQKPQLHLVKYQLKLQKFFEQKITCISSQIFFQKKGNVKN